MFSGSERRKNSESLTQVLYFQAPKQIFLTRRGIMLIMKDLAERQAEMRRRQERGGVDLRPFVHVRKCKTPVGIDNDEVNVAALFREQDKRCAICRHRIRIDPNEPVKRVACIDHNHRTGNVRGLLCRQCNFLLGSAYECVEILEAAIWYIKFHNRPGLRSKRKNVRVVSKPRSIQLMPLPLG